MNDPLNLFSDENHDPLGLFDEEEGALTKAGKVAAGAAEVGANLISSGIGQVAGGLAGLASVPFGGVDAGVDVSRDVADTLTYSPKTERGQAFQEPVNKVMGWIGEQANQVGPQLVEATPFIGEEIAKDPAMHQFLGEVVGQTGANFLPLDLLARGGNKLRKQPAPRPDTLGKIEPTVSSHGENGQLPQINMDGVPPMIVEGDPLGLFAKETPLPELNRAVETDVPHLGMPEAGTVLPNADMPLPKIEAAQPRAPLDVGLAEGPAIDGGVRHTDPATGGTVQGMDASFPTIDFPLKTEMIDADPTIRNLREAIAAQEAQLAHMQERGAMPSAMDRVRRSLDDMKAKFQKYMDEGYGVTEARDAFPDLIETGKGTKLPVKHGFRPKQQGGAIHPDLLTFGVNRLIEHVKNKFPEDGGRRLLTKFVGTFDRDELNRAVRDSNDPKSREHLYWMTPDEFLAAAKERKLDNEFMREEKRSSIRKGLDSEKGLTELPMLLVENGAVVGHEGRHRMDVFKEKKLDRIPVRIRDTAHRNEAGGLPYPKLISENGKAMAIPEKIAGLKPAANTPAMPPRAAAMNGPLARQAGALNVKEIREGLGVASNKLAKLFQQPAKKPVEPSVTNPTLKALSETAAGKGLADFTDLLKTPDEVIEIAKQATDIERAPVQERIENGGLFRGLATKNPVVKYTTGRLVQADKAAKRLIREHLTDTVTGLKGFMRKLDPTAKGEIWAKMMELEGQRELLPEELSRFDKAQQDFYKKFREIDEMFYNKFNEARAALGMAPMDKRTAHIAGRFTGDFYQMAYRAKLDAAGNPLFDENGRAVREVIGRIPGHTRGEVQRAAKFIKEQHPDWELGDLEYKAIGKGSSAGDRFAGFMEVLNLVGRDNPHTKQLLDTYREFMKSDAATFRNALRHAEPKKAQAGGIVGSEGNKAWKSVVENAEEGMKAQLTYLENGFQWLEMQKASSDIGKVLSDETVAERLPNAVAWSEGQLNHALGRNLGVFADAANVVLSEVGKLSGIGHTSLIKGSNTVKHLMMQKFMGFMNIPFTLTQLIQPLQTVPPMAMLMKARGIEHSMMKAGAAGTETMMKLLYAHTPLTDKWSAHFSDFENRALQYAHDNDVFNVQMADHTKDINASKAKDVFDFVADANIKYPEFVTRGTAFMSFAHALKETGMPFEQVMSTAENLTKVTMVDYSTLGRPKMYGQMGWLGDLASTLARYKHNQISQLTLYGREFREGMKRGEGLKFSTPLLTYLGTSIAFGGLTGMISYNIADEAYRLFSEHVLKKADSLTDMILRTKEIPQMVSHGVFAATGIDMSSRFSNAAVIPDNVGEFLLPYGAGLADMLESGWDFAKNPNEWNTKRLATSVAPSSLTGLLENQLFTEQEGPDRHAFINRRTGERNVNRTDKEVGMRNFGFRSMRETTERNVNYEFKQKEQAEQRIRQRVLDKAWSDYLSKGSVDYRKYAQAYLDAGSDQFFRDFQQRIAANKLTERERIIKRNDGNNYSGARNLQELMNKGYNKE